MAKCDDFMVAGSPVVLFSRTCHDFSVTCQIGTRGVESVRLEPARVESVRIEGKSAKHQFPNQVEPANLAEL